MAFLESAQALLARANRILAREGVLDAFGHVSTRDPADSSRFYLSRSLAPELVTAADVLEFNLSSEPIKQTSVALYSERVIHGSIYASRPDVHAICHHHSPAMLPFCLTELRLSVVTQLGAAIGKVVPRWDQRDEFGATNHLVTRHEEAISLARCLGDDSIVLMKRHGATVVASSLKELAFRSVYSCRDAELQLRALQYGAIDTLSDAEIEAAERFSETTISRAWDLWSAHLDATEG
jgi:HCOMODA/2-hydroxy-3-carboxy-muconic semialdehyde decarboxylase